VLLNPQDQDHLSPDGVLFVAVRSDEQINALMGSKKNSNNTEWIDKFMQQRKMASQRDHVTHQEKFQHQPWQDNEEFTSMGSLASGSKDRTRLLQARANRAREPSISSRFLLHDPDAINQEDMIRTMQVVEMKSDDLKSGNGLGKFASMVDVRVTLPGLPKIVIPRSRKPRLSVAANVDIQAHQELSYAMDEGNNVTDGRLDMIVKHGSHYVVILMTDGVWQQVEAIINPLRQPYLHKWVPIVIVTPVPPPAKLKGSHTGVYFVTGNPHQVSILDKVGIRVAKSIILLTGKPMRQEPVMMDHHVVLTASLIEAQVSNVANDIPLIIDMHNPHNIGQLAKDIPSSFVKHNSLTMLKANMNQRKEREERWVARRMRQRAASVNTMWIQTAHAHRQDAEVNPGMHPRFASGRVMSRVDLCTVFATAYYTPGVMEVMEAFLLPGRRDQVSFTYSIPVPFPLVGCTFIQLYSEWMESGVLSYGLYRPSRALNNDMPFCLGFPHPSTVLLPQDKVFVLSPADWAKHVLNANEMQLTATLKIQAVFRASQNFKEKKKKKGKKLIRGGLNSLIRSKESSSPVHSDTDLDEEIQTVLKTSVGTSNSLPMVTRM